MSDYSDDQMSFGDDDDVYGDSGGDEYYEEPDSSSPITQLRKVKYNILRRDDILERQQQTVRDTADLLAIPTGEAARVLRYYKWDSPKLQDEWFTDPDAVRARVGLVDEGTAPTAATATCAICFEPRPVAEMAAARCKTHFFCKDCWQGYTHAAVEAGPSCLELRCPAPECKAVVPTALALEVCDEMHARRYREFAVRSFVDDNRRLAWCTAPGCPNAAEATGADAPREAMDVHCLCGNSFCFVCKEEAHRPVDCDTVRRWMVKNSAESENMTWILANTKPCPKCNRAIEKNQGCMHMTCPCRHEFCWLCLGSWSDHGERTGGFYSCNTFRKKQEAGGVDEAENQRARARASLERYMHYWQRWAEHDKARRTALRQLSQWENELLEILSERTATPVSQLKFVLDAWKEVVSCRRVLKWTYAVGYYAYDNPDEPASGSGSSAQRGGRKEAAAADKKLQESHKEFFEFTQQEAENALERMNSKVEKQLGAFVREGVAAPDPAEWALFREELIGLTDVTRLQFAKLVDFLEKGLDEGLAEFREPAAALQQMGDDGAGPSNAAGPGSGSGAAAPSLLRRVTRQSKRGRGTAVEAGGGGAPWQCPTCTFVNESGNTTCEMCNQTQRRAGAK